MRFIKFFPRLHYLTEEEVNALGNQQKMLKAGRKYMIEELDVNYLWRY